jgi:hypothetical protein
VEEEARPEAEALEAFSWPCGKNKVVDDERKSSIEKYIKSNPKKHESLRLHPCDSTSTAAIQLLIL